MTTHGLHHVTAVTAQIQNNLTFYTNILGLRLVKQTVNQDDVTAYHLFYADAVGSPGSDMTFFDWSMAGAKVAGTDQISRTFWRVNGPAALEYWETRLAEHDISTQSVDLGSKKALLFADPEGQKLGLINDEDTAYEGKVWDKIIPAEYALRGFYAVELTTPEVPALTDGLIDLMGWELGGEYIDPVTKSPVTILTMEGGGPGKEVFVRASEEAPYMASTAGSVHHVAFRVEDEGELQGWIAKLEHHQVPHSGLVDRFYFNSLYFRITPGILFELATDGPGFATDESLEHLGEGLSLPPFLESHREAIEAGLTPLTRA